MNCPATPHMLPHFQGREGHGHSGSALQLLAVLILRKLLLSLSAGSLQGYGAFIIQLMPTYYVHPRCQAHDKLWGDSGEWKPAESLHAYLEGG